MTESSLKNTLEALLMAAGRPLSLKTLCELLENTATLKEIENELTKLAKDCESRSFELREVASGFRFQVREQHSVLMARLWQEKPQRYSAALLETLAIIAYLQPVTRGKIEETRGVSLSAGIMRTLEERGWIKTRGYKEAPGHPALYVTTKSFLDYFNLSSLSQLPPLPSLQELKSSDLFSSATPTAKEKTDSTKLLVTGT